MEWMTVILWGAGALILTFVVYYFTSPRRARWPGFSAFAQGYGALVTVVALFIAAGIYFVERKDKPSIEFDVSAARALIPARERTGSQVLLAIQIRIKNNSSRQVTMNCIALDIYRPVTGQTLRRNDGAPEEMLLEQLPRSARYPRSVVPACIQREQSPQGVRPLFMWPQLVLEPNEADDRYFEVPVSCAYPFVRVLVKLRLRPRDRLSYETKALIPLREICQGAGGGMPTSVSESSTAAGGGPIAPASTKQ